MQYLKDGHNPLMFHGEDVDDLQTMTSLERQFLKLTGKSSLSPFLPTAFLTSFSIVAENPTSALFSGFPS